MSEDEQRAYPWPIEHTIRYSFAIVDAMLWEFFIEHPQTEVFTARRQAVTTGSARFKVQLSGRKQDGDVGIFYARAGGDHITHIQIMPGELVNREGQNEADLWWHIWSMTLTAIVSKLRAQTKTMEAAIEKDEAFEAWKNGPVDQTLDPVLLAQGANVGRKLLEVTPRAGRPVIEINEWARQQIQRGHTRPDVLKEYLQRRSIDPDDETEMAKAKDAFRKALTRTKRT